MRNQKNIIVIGAGIAGLSAAIKAVEGGAFVQLFSLLPARFYQTVTESEGINAALNTKGEGDSSENHFAETIAAGGFLAHSRLAKKMCEQAPGLVRYLDRIGVPFNRTAEGFLDLKKLPEAKFQRAVYAGSQTGQQVLFSLDEQVRRFEVEQKLERFEGWEFVSAVLDSEKTCCAIIAQNIQDGEWQGFAADAVIVCAGGYEGLYGKQGQTGSALASLYRQGAYFANGEFVQFDDSAKLKCSLGGLWIDESHMTNLTGIFAAGSSEFQYHGASALAGNSILSCLFAGLKAGESVLNYVSHLEKPMRASVQSFFDQELQKQKDHYQHLLDLTGSENIYKLHEELTSLLLSHVGVERNNILLHEAHQKVLELRERFKRISVIDKSIWMNQQIQFVRQFEGMLDLAEVVVLGALLRNESRGTHRKPEYPERDDDHFLKTTKAKWTQNGPEIFYEDTI